MTSRTISFDVSEDSPARFAADLRALQRAAGDLTGVALANHARLSKTVVADALAGRRLPSERTVALLAPALGSDVDALVERRNALHTRMTHPPAVSSPVAAAAPDTGPDRAPRMLDLRTAILLCAASSAATGVAAVAAMLAFSP